MKNFDRERERCWIAEMDGEPVGSVFVVKQSRTVAKLRLLIVEPKARGRGLGKRLVEECIAFARARATASCALDAIQPRRGARNICQNRIQAVKRQPHREFGVRLVGEYWELKL